MNPKDLKELFEDNRIAFQVKIENLMLVSLGLRSCSLTTIPAELPSGAAMGKIIDARFIPRMEQLRAIQDLKARVKAIGDIKKGMTSAFEEIVEGSSEYKALGYWAKRLELKMNQVEVRPTVHEYYLYQKKDVLKELQKLMQERGKLKLEELKKPDPSKGRLRFAYPEEFNGAWLRRMGRLLGYPDCCVDRYASDRENDINVESRAATQLKDLDEKPDLHVFFDSNFFPCNPTCEKAREKGERYHSKLTEALPEVGQAYENILRENLEKVRTQPEIIGEYLGRLKEI